MPSSSRSRVEPVEDRLPVAVAGEIVVRDEEMADALSGVVAHAALDVIGRAVARLRPWTLMMVQKLH